jgi:peptide/nickel transport system permease protein
MNRAKKITTMLGDIPWIPCIILTAILVMALFAPFLAPYSPTQGDLSEKLRPPSFAGGTSQHFLGTDFLGRDCYSRLLYGARVSLVVSVISIFFAGTLGTLIGMSAGYRGGWAAIVLMRFTDIGLAIPLILMAIIMAAVFGASFLNVIVVLALLMWPRYSRQIHAETLVLKEQEFVALAKVANLSPFRIMIKHILPNLWPTLLVLASLQVGFVILVESSLSFLGVGVPPPTPAWGLMVAEGRGYITSAWWVALFPGAAIMFTVLAFNLLGDWLRDRLDPKLRQI